MNKKNDNIDSSEGIIYPKNAQIQGELFEHIKPFVSYRRYHQLIKKVKYKIEVEYFDEQELGE